MKAAIPDIVRYWIILTGMVLFIDADVLNRYPEYPLHPQQEQASRDASFLLEGKTCQTQQPLLHQEGTEQHLQEVNRYCAREGGAAGMLTTSTIAFANHFRGKLVKEGFHFLSNPVPIYIKVLFLRL